MVNQAIRTSDKLAPVVETIFHWREHDPSNCLLRIYVDTIGTSAIIVASKLYSETPGKNHISADFEQLALAINKKYQGLLDNVQEVTWIAHYGVFSVVDSFENETTTEVFSKVLLSWPLPQQLTNLESDWKQLDIGEQEELTKQFQLAPVADVLSQLACAK